MNSRVVFTIVVAVVVLAFFWLSLGPPPAPTQSTDVPGTLPATPDAPPSAVEPLPERPPEAAPLDEQVPVGGAPTPRDPDSGAEEGTEAEASAAPAADDDDSAGGFKVQRPYPVDRDGIQGAMTSQLDVIRECYDAWVQKNPDIEGKIVLGFTIEADEEAPGEAAVRGVEIKDGSTVDHVFLEGCVVSAVDELRFEAPADGGVMVVNYPFMFRSE